jgi:hypothetical protein
MMKTIQRNQPAQNLVNPDNTAKVQFWTMIPLPSHQWPLLQPFPLPTENQPPPFSCRHHVS